MFGAIPVAAHASAVSSTLVSLSSLEVAPLATGASLVSSPSVTLSSSAAGATGVTYDVQFTTSKTGALAQGSGTITITAPSGTVFPASGQLGIYDETAQRFVGGTPNPTLSHGGTVATYFLGDYQSSIPAGDVISFAIGNVTNPSRGSYSLDISTSSDTTPVATGSYTIAPAQALSGVSVGLASSAANAQGIGYSVRFTSSANGDLEAGVGESSTITVVAPAGTVFETNGISLYDQTTQTQLDPAYGVGRAALSDGGATITVTLDGYAGHAAAGWAHLRARPRRDYQPTSGEHLRRFGLHQFGHGPGADTKLLNLRRDPAIRDRDIPR